jgi:hypothetical protein
MRRIGQELSVHVGRLLCVNNQGAFTDITGLEELFIQ